MLCRSSPYWNEEGDWRLVNLSKCTSSFGSPIPTWFGMQALWLCNINKQPCTHQKTKLEPMSYVWRTFRRCLPCFVVQGARQWGWRYCAIQCHACRIAWASQFTRCRGFSNNELSIGYGKSCARKVPMCKKMCLVKILWMMWFMSMLYVMIQAYHCHTVVVSFWSTQITNCWMGTEKEEEVVPKNKHHAVPLVPSRPISGFWGGVWSWHQTRKPCGDLAFSRKRRWRNRTWSVGRSDIIYWIVVRSLAWFIMIL